MSPMTLVILAFAVLFLWGAVSGENLQDILKDVLVPKTAKKGK